MRGKPTAYQHNRIGLGRFASWGDADYRYAPEEYADPGEAEFGDGGFAARVVSGQVVHLYLHCGAGTVVRGVVHLDEIRWSATSTTPRIRRGRRDAREGPPAATGPGGYAAE